MHYSALPVHHVQTHALSAADLALESLIGERVRSRRHSRGSTSPITCGDLPRDYPPDASYDADCATVRFDVIDNWEEVCAQASEPPLGSTFDDLVTYVEGSPTIVAENVMVDGYRGMHLRGDGCGSIIRGHAPVAQWIERRPPEPSRLSVVATRVRPRAKQVEFYALGVLRVPAHGSAPTPGVFPGCA